MINSENMTCATVPPPSNFPHKGEGWRAKNHLLLPMLPSLVGEGLGVRLRLRGESRANLLQHTVLFLPTYYFHVT